jgi:ketosteroid isomerase-like protein
MIWRLVGICLGLSVGPAILVGQSSKVDLKAEEAAIRSLIAGGQRASFTEDAVFWSGAFPRPAVGSQRPEPYPGSNVGKRTNQKETTKVERLEVASSGDMAWEFSYGKLEYDVDESPSRHVSFDTALLRVWRKLSGQWKVKAAFMRPLDLPFAPH